MAVASSSGENEEGCERGILVVAKTEWWREEEGRNFPRKRSQESGGISGRARETTLAAGEIETQLQEGWRKRERKGGNVRRGDVSGGM